jgi:hypothetical protein
MRRQAPPINSMERKEPPHNRTAIALHYAKNLPLISRPVELNRFAVVLFCPEKPGLLGQDSFLLFFEN